MTSEQSYPCCDKMNGPAWIDGRYCRPVCEVHGYQTEPEARQHQTSKLRPAVEVWWKADTAFGAACLGDGRGDQAAAAVIEADREAVRAEVVGEIVEWLWANTDYSDDDEREYKEFLVNQIEAKFGTSNVAD